MMPLLIAVCPSYREVSQKLPDEDLLYVALGHFADHLLELHQQHQTDVFPAVAQVIERLHIEGEHYVQEAATIGLLEGIQNGWSGRKVDPDLFARYLLPVSLKRWQSLNDFWSGKSKSVGDRP
jgi:hypothetical protein